jgi:hypothetical protein
MKILHLATKGKYMNTLEKFHIYKIRKKGIQINETYSDHTNPIYDILIKTKTEPLRAVTSPSSTRSSLSAAV